MEATSITTIGPDVVSILGISELHNTLFLAFSHDVFWTKIVLNLPLTLRLIQRIAFWVGVLVRPGRSESVGIEELTVVRLRAERIKRFICLN